ncbi:unnamed protein product, partial [Nesidiocoris tenuis]
RSRIPQRQDVERPGQGIPARFNEGMTPLLIYVSHQRLLQRYALKPRQKLTKASQRAHQVRSQKILGEAVQVYYFESITSSTLLRDLGFLSNTMLKRLGIPARLSRRHGELNV